MSLVSINRPEIFSELQEKNASTPWEKNRTIWTTGTRTSNINQTIGTQLSIKATH